MSTIDTLYNYVVILPYIIKYYKRILLLYILLLYILLLYISLLHILLLYLLFLWRQFIYQSINIL